MTKVPGEDSRRARRKLDQRNSRSLLRNKTAWIWAGTGLVVVLIGAGVWIGIHAFQAKAELEKAQSLIGTMKDQAASFDIDGATKTFDVVSTHTENARNLTDDFVWRTAEFIPLAGANLRAFRELAAVTDSVMVEVAAPLIQVAGSLDPSTLAPKDGAIDLAPFVAAVPAVAAANEGIKAAVKASEAIDTSATIGQVTAAHKKVDSLLSDAAPLLQTADQVLPLLPQALGADDPQTYLVMFQNNAELRALGGAALSFAPVTVDNGTIVLGETVQPSVDDFDSFAQSPVPVPDGADAVYPGYGTSLINSTQRPGFSESAAMVSAMWEQLSGPVDGVVSIDPVALGYVLRATDPITLSTGDVLKAESLVPLLLNDVYLRFTSKDKVANNLAQDNVFGEAVDATFGALTGGPLDVNRLLDALSQGWSERRIMYWSSDPAQAAALSQIGTNGELPVSDSKTERIGLYVQDAVGAKINFYLRQDLTLSQGTCRTDGLTSYRASFDLKNTLAAAGVEKLPFHVTGEYKKYGLKAGEQRLIVRLYAPEGMQIVNASVNNVPVALADLHDTTWSVGQVQVQIPPEQTANITYDMIAADGPTSFEAQVTPMVHATNTTTVALDCATVPAG